MRDYFAELFVAGRFAEAGWNVYFPHRDEGFDFVVAKDVGSGHQLIRPVQVKGKYPTEGKTNKPTYGYVGGLTQIHPEMVLAIPFFPIASQEVPSCVAYLPLSLIRRHSKGYRCQPAPSKLAYLFRDVIIAGSSTAKDWPLWSKTIGARR